MGILAVQSNMSHTFLLIIFFVFFQVIFAYQNKYVQREKPSKQGLKDDSFFLAGISNVMGQDKSDRLLVHTGTQGSKEQLERKYSGPDITGNADSKASNKLGETNDYQEENTDNFMTDVLILGAGMAGVAAAETLNKLGVKNVMVVEGADRIGGRVKEVPFGSINVEVGANWVHHANMKGVKDIPLDNMVKEAGLNFVEDEYGDYIFRYKGKNVTDEANIELESIEDILQKSIELSDRKKDRNEPDINYRAALRLLDWRPKNPIQHASEYFCFDFEFGDEPEDTGLKNNAEVYKDHLGHDNFIADKRGFSQIIRNMADKIPLTEGNNLYFNKYVTEIKYNEPGDYPIKVTANDTQTGEAYSFKSKWVIVTFSVGVLKSDLVSFVPKLPPWKEEVIYMFKMVRYIKIFIKFPDNIEAFWDDNHYIMYVDPHIRGKYQVWQNLEARGKYYPKGTNILLCTVVGEFYDIVQTKSKEEELAELYTVLKDMYGDEAVMPEDILIPDWHTNPLFFGSYSNWPIGVSKTVYDNLDAPIGRFYMAGEACMSNGYLHGALQSGQKTAGDLFNCMMKNHCEKVPKAGYGYSEDLSNRAEQNCPVNKPCPACSRSAVCNEPKGTIDNCKKLITVYTYDKYSQRCLPYFGCTEGKGNKFNSKEECDRKCSASFQ